MPLDPAELAPEPAAPASAQAEAERMLLRALRDVREGRALILRPGKPPVPPRKPSWER
jgi:hypothetical protein